MKGVNFNNIQKNTLNVELPSGLVLMVYPPKKGQIEKLVAISETQMANPGEVYDIAASLLSNNKQGREVQTQELENLDVADIKYLLKAYMEFTSEEMGRPN